MDWRLRARLDRAKEISEKQNRICNQVSFNKGSRGISIHSTYGDNFLITILGPQGGVLDSFSISLNEIEMLKTNIEKTIDEYKGQWKSTDSTQEKE